MLARSVSLSVLLHALGMVAMVLYGNEMTRQPVMAPKTISVRLVQAVQPPAEAAVVEVAEKPAPAPVLLKEKILPKPEAKPEVRVDPVKPPKEVPREKPKPELKPAAAPVTENRPRDPKTTKPAAVTPPKNVGPAESAVTGTDEDFPFDYYRQAIKNKIVANWNPQQLNLGDRAGVSCTIHFVVGRGGAVTQVKLLRNSGLGVYDREALRAAQTTRLPPLPAQYSGKDIGVTFDFNWEPGS